MTGLWYYIYASVVSIRIGDSAGTEKSLTQESFLGMLVGCGVGGNPTKCGALGDWSGGEIGGNPTK